MIRPRFQINAISALQLVAVPRCSVRSASSQSTAGPSSIASSKPRRRIRVLKNTFKNRARIKITDFLDRTAIRIAVAAGTKLDPRLATAPILVLGPKQPMPRRRRLLYAWYGLVLFGGISTGLAIRNFANPSLPVPGSREDRVLLDALSSDAEQLDVVKFMRSQLVPVDESSEGSERKGWVELKMRTHITESQDDRDKQTRTITGTTLAGSKGLGVQRAFWNIDTKELVAAVWIGSAMSGWPMMAHGGGIATIFEDCMSRMVAGPDASIDSIARPTSMSVTYAKPTYSTNFYILRANYSESNLAQTAPPVDGEPQPAKSWLPWWKDFTKKEQPIEAKKTVEMIGTLESVDGELCVRVKGTFPVTS